MHGTSEPPGEKDVGKPADYLANERTFLAWVRTAVAILALGFVVVKFGLVTRELAGTTPVKSSGVSAPIGVALVLLGGALVLVALARYESTNRAIAMGVYRPRGLLTYLLAAGVSLTALLLAVYLGTSG
jgi:putative membrane protein